jgi:hypothetical protein
MKQIFLILLITVIIIRSGFCQEKEIEDKRFLLHGLVMDAMSFSPIPNSQIIRNRVSVSVSAPDGTFVFYVNVNDSIVFQSLGYKSVTLLITDTLKGKEFIAGIYLNSDTLSIGEVIIVPRYINLKSEILNSPVNTQVDLDNARYNVAISAYQGRYSVGKLSDPSSNYEYIRQKQKTEAFERGGIPSDKILGISSLILIPAAYIMIFGMPEKPPLMKAEISDYELDQLQRKYFETLKRKN